MWPNNKLLDLLRIDLPIIQAPMAGYATVELAAGVSAAGGLGSLGLSMSSPDEVRSLVQQYRSLTAKPVNANFFCHEDVAIEAERHRAWHDRLAPYRQAAGLNSDSLPLPIHRPPFGAAMCAVVEDIKPEVMSFHFGLPEPALVARVKAAGCRILCSATTVAEARRLEQLGADAIIAQGAEAGGHRGMFLTHEIASQPGTMTLVPQIADAVAVPVIAAGGIGDARGIAAAFALGADGVQIGTAFLFCPEAAVPPLHRAALRSATADQTVLTNVFTGRPARVLINRFVREAGPIGDDVPPFPQATSHYAPLRQRAEAEGKDDFTPLWAGQTTALGREIPAAELTRGLAAAALERLTRLGGR
ncbi:MAG: nitronate monooxygenase [Acetobacteraceae bacterium]|jgi:nitronate monooxygenase|nr:nitronate monooxygenase [Acetobacteraceae bacterium]